jgi:hypothetical protein
MKNFVKALRILAHIKYVVNHYSNDFELGAYVRQYVNRTSKPRKL